MSKIIIYDNKKLLIADLERTENRTRNYLHECANYKIPQIETQYEFAAIFRKYKIIHSISLKKQLKKIEKIMKYHKERKSNG